jgi:hypothetical protein
MDLSARRGRKRGAGDSGQPIVLWGVGSGDVDAAKMTRSVIINPSQTMGHQPEVIR